MSTTTVVAPRWNRANVLLTVELFVTMLREFYYVRGVLGWRQSSREHIDRGYARERAVMLPVSYCLESCVEVEDRECFAKALATFCPSDVPRSPSGPRSGLLFPDYFVRHFVG